MASEVSWLERRTGVARSRVQTPLKSWLFRASIRNCLNCVHNCDDHGLLDFKSAVQYNYETFHISLLNPHMIPDLGYWVKSETTLWHYVIKTHYCRSGSSLRFNVQCIEWPGAILQGCNDSTVGFSGWITLSWLNTSHSVFFSAHPSPFSS